MTLVSGIPEVVTMVRKSIARFFGAMGATTGTGAVMGAGAVWALM
jgi:hypothetical protein